MNHWPFDHGSLATLSALAGQKTIKAMCGKRVPFCVDATEQKIDCPACRSGIQARIMSSEELIKIAAQVPNCDAVIAAAKQDVERFVAVLQRGY